VDSPRTCIMVMERLPILASQPCDVHMTAEQRLYISRINRKLRVFLGCKKTCLVQVELSFEDTALDAYQKKLCREVRRFDEVFSRRERSPIGR
jgi:hypothetical protein